LKRIAIYGGTFDPVHHGHLILARDACERLGLDQVIFIPAAVSPFKPAPDAPADLRWTMLRAALSGEERFIADDFDLRRPPPSYAITTVMEIRQREPAAEFFYLIGDDNVSTLGQWHRFEDLKKLVHFIVLDRSGTESPHEYPIIRRKIDISGTEIRKRVACGLSIRYLVPAAVEEIIRQGNLYREGAK
jgi:nicotinate-nucleotide adenylyltransferase